MLNAIIGYRLVTSLNRYNVKRLRVSPPIMDHASHIPHHVPSVRGLSPPAMDSRMEVSAWTFFIL